MMILTIVFCYFCLLFAISRFTGKQADNDTFYRGNRQSPWYMVAFGMVGASISGVTFVSVPGMVTRIDMTYLQTCLGFILGYVVVAFVLLPLYYKLNLTTIYSFLGQRLGRSAYRTGASFFLLSKMTGAAVRFYVVCWILQQCLAVQAPEMKTLLGDDLMFCFTAFVMVALIWLYTRKGGIRTLVWTDSLQTTCLFGALILMLIMVMHQLNMGVGEAIDAIRQSEMSRVFVFDDWMSKQNFWKQFLSGVFIVIVMTGLDQDMMQKNLTCRSLRDAQKDMCTYGVAFVPANLLFLSLGVLLVMLLQQQGMAIPAKGDELLPMVAASGMLGETVVVLFVLGILAASFSSADSALTAMTTSFCVDLCGKAHDEQLRKQVHLAMSVAFIGFVLLFRMVNSTSVIDAIYVLCGYTYGPLLGLFAFGMLTHRGVKGRMVPVVCIASPLLCWLLDVVVGHYAHYHFGYELLMLNGLFTFVGLLVFRNTPKAASPSPS